MVRDLRQVRTALQDHATVAALISNVEDASIHGNVDVPVSSIVFDSRRTAPGSLFVALRGGYVDGHDYLGVALAAGAVAAMVEPDTDDEAVRGYQCVIRTMNTRGALAPIAAEFFGQPSKSLDLVGVTGTDGKTTTSFYLQQILEACGQVSGLISTVAVRVPGQPDRSSARQTTPESLDVQRTLKEMADAGARVAIVETTSHALESHRVDCCHFDLGVVTNITREHLDFHGNVENYRNAKAGLLRRVVRAKQEGKRGTVILNADDEGCHAVAFSADGADVIWYSMEGHPSASIRAESVVTSPGFSTFTLHIHDDRYSVRLHMPGGWNVANVLAASGAAHVLGCSPQAIVRAIENLDPVPGRLQSVDFNQPFTVVVDYAHTPDSIRSVLDEARRITNGRVLIAFGSAGERDVEKRALQGGIAAQLADYSIFTSEDPRFEDPDSIIDDIARGAEKRGAIRGVDFHCIEDRRVAVNRIIGAAHPGDVVILAGKGHEQSMIYGAENRPWDEVTVVQEALEQLGFSPTDRKGTQV